MSSIGTGSGRLYIEKETCPEHLPILQSTDDLDREFEEWKQKFEKTYASAEEEAKRKQLWLNCKKSVTEHNILYEKGLETYKQTGTFGGLVTYSQGMNQFSDMLVSEMCCGGHRNSHQN